jgi:hypothetical protein
MGFTEDLQFSLDRQGKDVYNEGNRQVWRTACAGLPPFWNQAGGKEKCK